MRKALLVILAVVAVGSDLFALKRVSDLEEAVRLGESACASYRSAAGMEATRTVLEVCEIESRVSALERGKSLGR